MRPRRDVRASRARDRRCFGASAAGLVLALAAAPAPAAPCQPWPGEPDPLPTRADPNPLRVEWAELRIRELAQLAQRFEPTDSLRAQSLWRRLLCMDPGNDEALAGVLRARAVQVHRPPLREAPYDAPSGGDAWATLGAPIELPTPWVRVERPPAGDPSLGPLRDEVASLGKQVQAAEFDAALESSTELRERLAAAPAGPGRNGLIAQTEVLAATAQLALGRSGDAAESLRRALAADPALHLDPATTSPKVLRAFEAVREEAP